MIEVHVAVSVEARASGASTIVVSGDATIDAETSGSSTIRRS